MLDSHGVLGNIHRIHDDDRKILTLHESYEMSYAMIMILIYERDW